jgi:L,D-peptidoglycan transpeptidase YkuD (ErfK/YbiS/YcfS/YnhG family)
VIITILLCGCSGLQSKSTFKEAHDLFDQGNYDASLNRYERIIEKYPAQADRGLFEMGIIHLHPLNERRDFQKSVECFERLLKDYPGSVYRQDTQMMVFYINNVAVKDQTIAAQKTAIETLKHEAESTGNEMIALQRQIKDLEHKVFVLTTQKGAIDRILILKGDRQLMLISKGETLRTYKIALGGNPLGPKERRGDNKTPEGTYFIDARNMDSLYHLSLHISYPNERDRKRAKELGVSPGGNIMIHGIRNGFSWVGDAHTQVDWTKGCIAVTDEEIEEIAKVVPNGTTVEIRP